MMLCEKTNVHLNMFWNVLSQTSYVKMIPDVRKEKKFQCSHTQKQSLTRRSNQVALLNPLKTATLFIYLKSRKIFVGIIRIS